MPDVGERRWPSRVGSVRSFDARTGIERIDRDECLRLLAADSIGRLAVIVGGVPVVFPVNYALDGDALVVRTDAGAKLDAAGRARASFEIDDFDREARTGWSVEVTGRLEEVSSLDTPTLARVHQLPVDPWAGGAKDHWLRLHLDQVSGRRV